MPEAVPFYAKLVSRLSSKRYLAAALIGTLILGAAPFAAKALGWEPPDAAKWAWMRAQSPEYGSEDLSGFDPQAVPDGSNAFAVYEYLRKTIRTQTAGSEHLPLFAQVISEPASLAEVERLLTQSDTDPSDEIYSQLYAALVTAPAHPDVSYGALRRDITKALTSAEEDNHSNSQGYAWFWSYSARGCVEAYRGTQEDRFLDLLVSSFDEILRYRDSELQRPDIVRGRILRSWGHADLVKKWGLSGPGQVNVVTTPGRIGFPVLLFTQLVREEPRLSQKYGEKAEEYLEAISDALDEFDEDFRLTDDQEAGYYWEPAQNEIEKLNHMLSAGKALVLLAQLTGKEKYDRTARQLARYYRRSLWVENDAYVWTYEPTPKNPRGRAEKVWKAHVTASFAPVAYDAGIEFDAEDMRKFTHTFMRNLHRGGSRFNRGIEAERSRFLFNHRNISWSYSYLPWIFFDRFEPRVREILEQAVATRHDLFPKGWFGNAAGTMAYAHRLRSIAEK